MKKLLQILILIVVVAGTAMAQTPMFFNTNAAGGTNVFPWGSTTNKVQWCIPAGSLGGVTAGNNITKVWFQSGGAYSNTYPIINIRLKAGTPAGLTGTASGPWEPGMNLVYTGTGVLVTTTAGQWFGFTLNTPWLYNPAVPLFVEVEQNSSSANQGVYQAVNITGAGNGRQWGTYGSTAITGVGLNQVNFGIDVLPATPCTVAPQANTIMPSSYTTCPMITNPTMSLASTYSFGGITYQWQSSTISPVGPFTPINGATLSTAPAGTIGITTWFNCVATCTNPGGGSTTITPTQFYVSGSVVSTVPYFEDFEGVQSNDRLPNCSWTAPVLGTTQLNTWTTSQSANRIAKSGSKFGTFNAPTANNHVYSNGITMQPGITYSAAIWYSTEYYGYSNWANLSLLVGSNQTPASLNLIATTAPAISGPYKLLSGVFTVPSAGDYYIAIRATGQSGSAAYLNFDDLSVTIPCTGLGAVNSPTLLTSASSNTICDGDMITINATGADTYLWDDGSNNTSWTGAPNTTTLISVTGTNTLTSCPSISSQYIIVNPTPTVMIIASSPTVCPGQVSYLNALGANTYAWSNGGNVGSISVAPNTNTTYSVVGTGTNGCAGNGTVAIAVKPQPTITVLPTQESCAGDMVSITANGAASYKWYSSSNPIILQGVNINVQLFSNTTFTVYGTGANGCTGISTISQAVSLCTGLESLSAGQQLNVYPNPSDGVFNLELSTGKISSVVITDLSGRVIMNLKGTDNAFKLDLSTLSKGVYYATVLEGNTSHMVRLIKE